MTVHVEELAATNSDFPGLEPIARERGPSIDGENVLEVALSQENRLSSRGEWNEGLRPAGSHHGPWSRMCRARHLRVAENGMLALVDFRELGLQDG